MFRQRRACGTPGRAEETSRRQSARTARRCPCSAAAKGRPRPAWKATDRGLRLDHHWNGERPWSRVSAFPCPLRRGVEQGNNRHQSHTGPHGDRPVQATAPSIATKASPEPRSWPQRPASAGSTIAGRCRRLGTRTGQGTRAHGPSSVGNDEPGSHGGRDSGGKLQRVPHQRRAQAPPLPPLIDTEPRHHDRRHRRPLQAPRPRRRHRARPAPGTNPAGSNPPPDRRHWRPR